MLERICCTRTTSSILRGKKQDVNRKEVLQSIQSLQDSIARIFSSILLPMAKQKDVRKGSFQSQVKKKAKASENPFDKFANARKKHEVLNRRVKGEDRNVGRARAKAIDERKKKLLKDLEAHKKSNLFVDRRFGENDGTEMSLEEKMFQRFQLEKIKKTRNKSLYNLEDASEFVLTHKGSVLEENNMRDTHDLGDDSDEENLGREVVQNLHFGGGLVAKKDGGAEGDYRKSRMDSLQEIVMKSKLHKMEKKEAKDAQELDRERLDTAYDDLVQNALLDFKPKKRDRSEDDEGGISTDVVGRSYDVAFRSMTFESKVKPSDRTKSAEEIAAEEKKKLEELEAARLKRMQQRDKDAKEAEAALGKKGKNKRVATDDDLEDAVDEYEGYKNRKDYLLHHDFGERDKDPEGELESVLEDEGAGDGESGSGDGEEEEEVEDNEDDEVDEESVEGEDEADVSEEEETGSMDEDEEEAGSMDEDEEEGQDNVLKGGETLGRFASLHQKWMHRRRLRIAQELSSSTVNPNMPHNITCPTSLLAFDELVETYVSSDDDMKALIDRILAWNNVNLPGKEGLANRGKMHNFLDILVKHTIRIGDSLSSPKNNAADIMKLLDHLALCIISLSHDLGESGIALWGKLLKSFEVQLQKKLRDYTETPSSCWPSLGRLILLRVLGHVFSVTDFEHSIAAAASLFLSQCLNQCPVSSVSDISSGIFVCTLLLDFTSETKKVLPEVATFLCSLVAGLGVRPGALQGTFSMHLLPALRKSLGQQQVSSEEFPAIHFKFFETEGSAADDASLFTPALLRTVQRLSHHLVTRFSQNVASIELLEPLVRELRALRPQDIPSFPHIVQEAHVELLTAAVNALDSATQRMGLHWRPVIKSSLSSKAPRFEMNYSMKKDKDEDRDRAKLKQLGRQLKRETKSTMREIRRDADFLDQERFREDTERKERLRDERGKNFAWMESEQATINQQVRMGKGLMKGGGSAITKKARVK